MTKRKPTKKPSQQTQINRLRRDAAYYRERVKWLEGEVKRHDHAKGQAERVRDEYIIALESFGIKRLFGGNLRINYDTLLFMLGPEQVKELQRIAIEYLDHAKPRAVKKARAKPATQTKTTEE